MRYLGIDLAWGENARTGLAELDSDGRLTASTSVVSDEDVAAFVAARATTGGLTAAIDAPLIVANDTGQRPCEREIGRLFGRYSAGAYPANRGNPAFHPQPRGLRLARRFDWTVDPAVRPGPDRGVAIEVYPHPAMVSLFGLDTVIPYKGKRGRDVAARQEAFTQLFERIEEHMGDALRLDEYPRWWELRDRTQGSSRQVDLDVVEDEVDAIFCAYLAWLWAHREHELMVVGDVHSGYIVTPPPPEPSESRHSHLDDSTGHVSFGDGVPGSVPTTISPSHANSAIGSLLDEISWEGNARAYRGGGRGRENVLTTEVFWGLDLLPRRHFLAPVLRTAVGADSARGRVAEQVEQLSIEVLPGGLAPRWASGESTGWTVQPDVLMKADNCLVYVEAKRITGGTFQARQIARSLQATLDAANGRPAVLLLVLGSAPPIPVTRHGRLSIQEALEMGLADFPDEDAERLRQARDATVAWTTWDQIACVVQECADGFDSVDESWHSSIHRLTAVVTDSVKRHGSG